MSTVGGRSIQELLDLTRTTTNNLPRLDFEAPQKYQDYYMVERMVRNGWQKKGGIQIQSNIALTEGNNAGHTKPYASHQLSKTDRQSQITTPWATAYCYWMIDKHEISTNVDPWRFVDIVKNNRQDAMASMSNVLEEAAWQTVIDSSDDLNPRGVPYWITIGSNNENGFYGGKTADRSGNAITNVGGITPVDQDRWCNYFKDVTGPTAMDEFVQAMDEVYTKTQFKAPAIAQDLIEGTLANYSICTNYAVQNAYKVYARKSNDNLGLDMQPFMGLPAFNRTPIRWIPQLETYANASITGANPMYFINWNYFKPFINPMMNFEELGPYNEADMPTVLVTWVFLQYGYHCSSRRAQGLISTV